MRIQDDNYNPLENLSKEDIEMSIYDPEWEEVEAPIWDMIWDFEEMLEKADEFGLFLINYHFNFTEEEKKAAEEKLKFLSNYLEEHLEKAKKVKTDLNEEDLEYIEKEEKIMELLHMLIVLINPTKYRVVK